MTHHTDKDARPMNDAARLEIAGGEPCNGPGKAGPPPKSCSTCIHGDSIINHVGARCHICVPSYSQWTDRAATGAAQGSPETERVSEEVPCPHCGGWPGEADGSCLCCVERLNLISEIRTQRQRIAEMERERDDLRAKLTAALAAGEKKEGK